MAKISLDKSIEAAKINPRTGSVLAGPEVTIPFGALVEHIETDRGRVKFRFLENLYSCEEDIFRSATRSAAAKAPAPAPAPAPAVAAAPPPPPAEPAPEPKLKFERLDAGTWAVARAKVPGGWLVVIGATPIFYPDAAHEWDGTSLP